MIRYLATASMLLAGVYLTDGRALAADPGFTDTEILIGDVEPLTGPPAILGVGHTIGVKIAIAEINAAGGINGRKIKYVLEDDGYVTARTIQGLRKVIDVDKVFAMLGISGSGQSIAAMPVLEKSGIPTVISVGPVKPLWQPPRKNVFIVGQAYEEGIRDLVTYLADKNPGKKWGLITQDDDYGVAVHDGFDAVVKDKKLNVVYSGDYKKGQQDFSSEMLRLKDAGVKLRQGHQLGLHHRRSREDEKSRNRSHDPDQLRARRAFLQPEAQDHAGRVRHAQLQAGELKAQQQARAGPASRRSAPAESVTSALRPPQASLRWRRHRS
jgi:branched-chain amino acid transport system substrate-binding protein